MQSESVARWANFAKATLKQVGLDGVLIDGKNDNSVEQQAMTAFLNQHVIGIVTIAVEAPIIEPSLKAAKAADIPVVAAAASIDPSGSSQFAAEYAQSDKELGQTAAAYLKSKFPGGAEYAALSLPGIYAGRAPLLAAEPILDAAGFKRDGTYEISLADILGGTTKGAVDLLTAHPDAKVLLGCCDYTPALTVPALKQAGFGSVLQTATSQNLSTLNLIRKGAPVATVAVNAGTGMLIAIDQILKHAATGAAIDPRAADGKFRYKMIDHSNVPPAGQYVFPLQAQAAPFVSSWKAAYGL